MHYKKESSDVLNEVGSNINGISDQEAKIRLEKNGFNELKEGNKVPIWKMFLENFKDPLVIILLIAAIVQIFLGEFVESLIIFVVVILNALLGVTQTRKAESSLDSLKKLSSPNAKVLRDGKKKTIPVREIVVGDIVFLEAGDYIPADGRLIEAQSLKVVEGMLTGEAEAVLKHSDKIEEEVGIGDQRNMVFSGATVVYGRGTLVVTETGMNTEVGKVATLLESAGNKQTPLQEKLDDFGKKLGIIIMILAAAIFIIQVIRGYIDGENMKNLIFNSFMFAIAVAVAAIPEALSSIVTIVLAVGTKDMAKKQAIIRKLPAVETLGSTSVICTDKTGTLTQNKMQVVDIQDVNGNNSNKSFTLELGCMCTDSQIVTKDGREEAEGEATENAIVNAGLKIGKNKENLYRMMQRVNEIPFDSERKMMTTIHKIGSKYRIITKGAPDVLIKRCSKYYEEGIQKTITSKQLNGIDENNNKMANNALRVLAIAYKDVDRLPNKIDSENIEKELTFVGLIGMIDPPREGVKEAVATCRKAGIKTVMITGDHITTAKAIAREIGILRPNDLAITGSELDSINQKTLEKDIMKYSVFARVSPEHKVRIVKAFRSTGAVVAMTGDGVNDAPALKNADIGISMGLNGTDVAKNASDMILTDDNFVTIVEAVKHGRNIFDNIKKAVHFLIATNIGEIVTIFVGLLLGLKSPLLAIQLLWINLVTDSFPAIALGLEPPEKNIMNKKPRNPKKGIFADGLWNKIIIEGVMIGILTLLAFSIGNKLYGIKVARTMAFVSLGVLELVHSFNIRSEESIFKAGLWDNKYLIGAFILGTLLQIIVVIIPSIANVFELVPLTNLQWIYTISISLLPLVIVEIQKRLNKEETLGGINPNFTKKLSNVKN